MFFDIARGSEYGSEHEFDDHSDIASENEVGFVDDEESINFDEKVVCPHK